MLKKSYITLLFFFITLSFLIFESPVKAAIGPGDSDLTLKVLSVEPITQTIFTDTSFENCIPFVEAVLYDVSNPNITYKDVLKVDWDKETYEANVKLGKNFVITGTYVPPTSGPLLDFTDAPMPSLELIFEEPSTEPAPITDLTATDLSKSKNYIVRLNFSVPLKPDQVILKASWDQGNTWEEVDITPDIHYDSKGAFYTVYPFEGGLHLFQLNILGGLSAGLSNVASVELPPTKAEDSADPEDSSEGNRGGGGRDEATRNPDSNILENVVNHDYILNTDIITAESKETVSNKKESSAISNENSIKSITSPSVKDISDTGNTSTTDISTKEKETKNMKRVRLFEGLIIFASIVLLILLLVKKFLNGSKKKV